MLCLSQVKFDADVPSLERIVRQLTKQSGLPVIVTYSSPELRGDLYDLHVDLAFARFPQHRVEVRIHRTDGIGVRETSGGRTVYLRSAGESTLLFATALALEALGGQRALPMSDESRRKCSGCIAVEELERRHRALDRAVARVLVIFVLMLPLLIPYWVGMLMWYFITSESRLREIRQRYSATLGGGTVNNIEDPKATRL